MIKLSIRILLADDHHVVRRGLSLLLNSYDHFKVIDEAENGIEAVAKTLELKPDIVLLDLQMPKLDGIEATVQIRKKCPETKIMILTSFSDKDHVIPALEAGANGYQLKESDPEELVNALLSLMNGSNQFHSKVTENLMTALQSTKQSPFSSLTNREVEVLREISAGKSNKEIAASLFITEKTVKTHVSNILSKLELQDRTQAALYAVRNGLSI